MPGREFRERINKKIREVEKNRAALDPPAVEQRVSFLESIRRSDAIENRLRHPKIFVSFAGSKGRQVMELAQSELSKLKAPDTGRRFKVDNGMRGSKRTKVKDHIPEIMESCCIFFGVLTREHQLDRADGNGDIWAPGAWVLLEAGIGIGLGLRVVYFFEDGISEEFWKDQVGDSRHVRFPANNPRAALTRAKELILAHYNELRNGSQ